QTNQFSGFTRGGRCLTLEEGTMKRIILSAIAILAFACYSTTSQATVTSFGVTSATISKSTGAIAVTGTIVCTAGEPFLVFTNIVQVLGGKNGLSGGIAPGLCTGSTD